MAAKRKGGIHINPKNKGKFNALKKRTGKTTEQLTHSKNPLTRKRAIFAQNARKWKHEDGGLLEENIGGIMSGVGSTLSAIPTPWTQIGGAAINLIGGLVGQGRERMLEQQRAREQEMQMQRDIDIKNRFSTTPESPTYAPVAKQGGFIVYKGESHDGPTGGILTDEYGNPSAVSQNKPIALTENNEVARYEPKSGGTYIYSDSLGFAKPASRLVNKYKLNKDTSYYKYDPLLKIAVDKQFDNLTQAQEFAKETKTKANDALGIFKNGGQLTSSKAKEMLRDGTAHGKKLTARQKRYFGWIAGGRKEDGGELINIPDNRKLDMVTGQPLPPTKRMSASVDSDYIRTVADKARRHGIDPYTALAINLQETRFNPNKMDNPFSVTGMVKSLNDLTAMDTDPVGFSMQKMAEKVKLAKRLGKKSDEEIIQAWNGYGNLRPNTEGIKNTAYGLELPINMNENPVYGRRVVNLRDSVIKTNPQIRKLIEESMPVKESGGLLPAYLDGGEEWKSVPRFRMNLAERIVDPIGLMAGIPGYTNMEDWNREHGGVDFVPNSSNNPIQLPSVDIRADESPMEQFYNKFSENRNRVNKVLNKIPSVQPGSYYLPGIPASNPTKAYGSIGSPNYKIKVPYSAPYSEYMSITHPFGMDLESVKNPTTKTPVITPRSGVGRPTPPPQLRTAGDVRDQAAWNASFMSKINPYNIPEAPGLQKTNNPYTESTVNPEEAGAPWLNPLGHALSAAGSIADYYAMKRAKPTPINAGRVGTERISLAQQRLTNRREAEAARAINTTNARNAGMNAGATMSSIAGANTGVNRLLGQQNAQSLENEANTNAQMAQQANMVNAQLKSEEAAFNAQRQDAYNAMLARMNPVGNLARTAASYFADNAGYQQGYDTLQMLAPNAELYNEPGASWMQKKFGRPKVRLRTK
jgi:hypothetical protein